ncbi:putative pentatricopeptide repeat-containing protein At3g01580 [Selaginella moellendorffii]|uniref:putative pentatricopeptide repeat-containing protein At3g01580 n=1 Tax=Selaginella moellendorffii TaxID=88036 RepID=UPI000D1C4A24|nr:putative pentatricopeptide repeat-containing protein At3g01580 [Selaginella moellendorffii]|eukprot:XP_002976721.2 putative pentatricopeptide repeat-containing protein At3g01580 [Selaginella moellendorffii]
MYLKCGSLADAREVIDRVRIGDVVTWTRLLAAYARNGDCERAIQAYQEMLQAGVTPNKITIVTLLNACVEHSCLPNTAQIRSNVFEMGFLSDAVVATVLVSMHSRFGRMEDACDAFREIQRHDVVSWNAMLWVYAENDYREEAMLLFREMQLEGSLPSKVSFLAVFNAVAAADDSLEARAMHGLFLRSGIEQDLALGNAIVDMYGKCGCLDEALDVFRSMPERDIISWTAMIAAFVQCGAMLGALDSFRLMQLQGIRPNKVTFLTVLNSGEIQVPLEEAGRIYGYVLESGTLQAQNWCLIESRDEMWSYGLLSLQRTLNVATLQKPWSSSTQCSWKDFVPTRPA